MFELLAVSFQFAWASDTQCPTCLRCWHPVSHFVRLRKDLWTVVTSITISTGVSHEGEFIKFVSDTSRSWVPLQFLLFEFVLSGGSGRAEGYHQSKEVVGNGI